MRKRCCRQKIGSGSGAGRAAMGAAVWVDGAARTIGAFPRDGAAGEGAAGEGEADRAGAAMSGGASKPDATPANIGPASVTETSSAQPGAALLIELKARRNISVRGQTDKESPLRAAHPSSIFIGTWQRRSRRQTEPNGNERREPNKRYFPSFWTKI